MLHAHSAPQALETAGEPQTPDPQVTDSTRLLCDFRNRQGAVRHGHMDALELWRWCLELSDEDCDRLRNAIEEQEARWALV